MKTTRLTLVAAAVLGTVALAALTAQADPPMDTPEACFDRLVGAIQNSDFDRFYSCHTKERRKDMLAMRDLFFRHADRMSKFELTITAPPDRTRTKTVVQIRISQRGNPNARSGTDGLTMIVEDGEWRLDEPFIR
jgi:hypothetical protein